MLGSTHALSGAVVFVAVAVPLSPALHLTPITLATGTIISAGAALLPDLDHPQATPARAFGPITATTARIIHRVSGGHRKATHSLVGVTVTAGLAVAATLNPWTLTVLLWLCIGLGVRALWKRPKNRPNGKLDYRDVAGLVHAGAALVVAHQLATSHLHLAVVPAAVVIGYATHLAGDTLTEQGVPWLWPNLRRYRLGAINTGSGVERYVVVPALYVGFAAVVYVTHGTWWPAVEHAMGVR